MAPQDASARQVIEELRVDVENGSIDTVILCATDMQGRLQGKRFHAPYFLDEIAAHGTEGCNYLLAVDVDMKTVGGYAVSSWEQGYGDFAMTPDLTTLRRIPWHPGTALVLADLEWLDGRPVEVSPRHILRRQLERLRERGLVAYAGTELEFVLYRDSYEDALRRGYRDLTPANLFNVDYSILGTSRVEPLLRRIRNEMAGAGLVPESVKGECNLGQHEITFRFAEALTCADHHVVYKNGAKEIAAQEGMSLTFMAKPNEREGNSCHIHFSLRSADGDRAVFSSDDHGTMSDTMKQAMAGLLTTMGQFTLFYAPNINSYKRYQSGSFAPTAIRWGLDNRTCALRVVGHSGPTLRVENRVPGGDANPYLALSAMVAGALYGIERELDLEDVCRSNAYLDPDADHVPRSLRDAVVAWESDPGVARASFGDSVVAHYANNARIELAAFDAAVTDWEMIRGFERL
jgi:glutamine synthetase